MHFRIRTTDGNALSSDGEKVDDAVADYRERYSSLPSLTDESIIRDIMDAVRSGLGKFNGGICVIVRGEEVYVNPRNIVSIAIIDPYDAT